MLSAAKEQKLNIENKSQSTGNLLGFNHGFNSALSALNIPNKS